MPCMYVSKSIYVLVKSVASAISRSTLNNPTSLSLFSIIDLKYLLMSFNKRLKDLSAVIEATGMMAYIWSSMHMEKLDGDYLLSKM